MKSPGIQDATLAGSREIFHRIGGTRPAKAEAHSAGAADVLLKSVCSHTISSALERAERPPQCCRALWAEAVGPVGRS